MSATRPLTDEEIARRDAFVVAIRELARQHNVAHRTGIKVSIESARIYKLDLAVNAARDAGIPHDALISVRTLIFG